MDTSTSASFGGKLLVGCIVVLTSLAFGTTINEKPSHLTTPFNPTNIDNPSNQPQIGDSSAQENIKIENRHLYDTVKHASGYDPDVTNNNNSKIYRHSSKELEEHSNSSSMATVTVRIHPRKSAVIQAIPRKLRGSGSIPSSSSTTTAKPFTRNNQHSLQATTAKDYGAGEPTTTIVYATSIPTTPARTFVNIRPVPLLSTQKYRSTVVIENKQDNHHNTENSDNTKPVVEQYSDEEQEQSEQEQKPHILEKPSFRIDSNSMQTTGTTTPRNNDPILPYHLHHTDQQKRNLYKSVPYARIRNSNDDIEEIPPNNRHSLYSNHKWTHDRDDYMQRTPPPASPHYIYDNQDPRQDYYQPPLQAPQNQNQNLFTPKYLVSDSYQDEMFNPFYVPTQQQAMQSLLSQQQRQQHLSQQQQQQYQPLTVRDFDLLLQLLVLRERRLHAPHEPFPSSNDFNTGNFQNVQQDNSYYYGPLAPKSPGNDNPYFRTRESKYMENNMPRSQQQPASPSTSRLLPSNVREELLFRMLLLALHLQPQPQPQPKPMTRITQPILPAQHMYLESSMSAGPAGRSPSSGSLPATYFGFRHRSESPKSPVRSVQVLGEID